MGHFTPLGDKRSFYSSRTRTLMGDPVVELIDMIDSFRMVWLSPFGPYLGVGHLGWAWL